MNRTPKTPNTKKEKNIAGGEEKSKKTVYLQDIVNEKEI
jgi:hypothetical protein